MERIASLIKELNNLQEKGAAQGELLAIVNQLQVLLQQSIYIETPASGNRISLWMPEPIATISSVNQTVISSLKTAETTPQVPEAEKEFEVLEVDQTEIEAELEEIRKNAAFTQRVLAQQSTLKPGILFSFEEENEAPELPTLVHQDRTPKQEKVVESEITPEPKSASPTINEQFKEEKREVVQFLGDTPIKDLRKAIGINDRYLFVQELFRGDEDMYERSIKTINAFSAFGEAHYWIERELKVKIGWDMSRQITKDFYALIRRRFS